MNGLLKNNLYGIMESVKIVIRFLVIIGVVLVFSGDSTLLSIYTLGASPIIAVLSISCLRKESTSKWNKYKLTFPVTRKDIIKSQYISHVIWSVSGVVVAIIFVISTILRHGNQYFYYGFRDAITLILGGGILAILIGSIAYPLYYLWDAGRTEIILVFSVVGAVGLVFVLSIFINFLMGDVNISNIIYYSSVALILLITVIVYIISFYISNWIFQYKEY